MVEINYLDFFTNCSNTQLINFLQENGLFKEDFECCFCEEKMILKPKNNSELSYSWKCMNYSCCKYETTISMTQLSFFAEFRLNVRIILKILLFLSKGFTLSQICSLI
ncbi:hypothetical protein DMUE_2163, partial [Dictyocoela muelleri]